MKSISANPKRKFLVVILLLFIGLVPTLAYASHGGSASPDLNVVGRYDVPYANLTSDVWAHTADNGRDYAYLGSFNGTVCSLDITGVRVVDITDPANPWLASFIPAKPGTRNNDVKVAHLETSAFSGDILVATNESCGTPFVPRLQANGVGGNSGQGGVTIWDVTDPTKPHALKQNYLPFPTHNTFIWQQGDSAYMIVVDDVNERDTHIIDMTKPFSPKEIATVGPTDWPDLDASEIPNAAVFLHDVWVQENDGKVIAYLSYWDAGLVLLDVTDPANPLFLGDSTYPVPDTVSGLPPAGDGHVAMPNASGDIAILGDEDFSKSSNHLITSAGNFGIGVALFGPDPTTTFPAGTVVWTGGEGCSTSAVPPASGPGEIALIQRGSCFFSTKAASAQAQGYVAYIVANDAARGDATLNMSAGTADVITIPGVFIGYSNGETLKVGTNTVSGIASIFDGEGYMRVLDVSDPGSIVQLGHFATEGVFSLGPIPGDRTAHNVIVRDSRAYWSWYEEGMRVVDFGGCSAGGGFESCTPTEVAHYVDSAGSNFWGVYVYDHSDGSTYILGSDMENGLWIFDNP